jgi:uncharacterized membrane protein YuzA (DUF378 family)
MKFLQGCHMQNVKQLAMIAAIIVLVGGINWGLVGLFRLDLVSSIVGHTLGRLVFLVVGVAAGYLIYLKVTKKVDLLIL